MEFGKRLKERREKYGLTQDQLGKLINVSDATINRYERNLREPDYETLKLLAKTLNCTTDYLLGLSDRPESSPKEKDEEEFDFKLAASNEDGYGHEPSPELKAFIKSIIKEELNKIQKK